MWDSKVGGTKNQPLALETARRRWHNAAEEGGTNRTEATGMMTEAASIDGRSPGNLEEAPRPKRLGEPRSLKAALRRIPAPFGGVKQSGYGRELGPEGLDAYFEIHTIFLNGENFVS